MLTTNNDKPSPERPIHANEIKCNVLSGALWYCGSADLMPLFQWSATLQLNASVSQLYSCLSPTASILLQRQECHQHTQKCRELSENCTFTPNLSSKGKSSI